jgi:hypothetical protein
LKFFLFNKNIFHFDSIKGIIVLYVLDRINKVVPTSNMVDISVAKLCRLSGLRLMGIDSNWGLWQEYEKDF